jgi:hypothetical protein
MIESQVYIQVIIRLTFIKYLAKEKGKNFRNNNVALERFFSFSTALKFMV